MTQENKVTEEKVKIDIRENYKGYENYNLKDIIHFDKEIELVNRKNKNIEKFHLTIVELQDPENKEEVRVLYYLNGEEINYAELLREYETDKPIRDVINEFNNDKEQEEERVERKRNLELEQSEKEKNKNEEQLGKKSKSSIEGKKPVGVIQKIDPHKTYVNNIETVSNAFGISSDVDEIAVADTQEGDKNVLSKHQSIYMLDEEGKIIQESNGKRVDELFEYDDETGRNPMHDKNIKIELDGNVEKNLNQTVARFKSKENPNLHLSAERTGIGQYNQMYAEEKTRDGNVAVGIELETNNSEVQTDMEEQKIRGYSSGSYKKEDIKKEVDIHVNHGDDQEKIPIENADGDNSTKVACESQLVPDTNITWEQFSKSIGDKDIDHLKEDFFKQYDGKNGQKLILEAQENYKEEKAKESENEKVNEDEYEGRTPWDSTKH